MNNLRKLACPSLAGSYNLEQKQLQSCMKKLADSRKFCDV